MKLFNEPSPLETRIISFRFGLENSASLDTYLAHDGYKALRKALEMTPDDVINEVKASNLRGRGGAWASELAAGRAVRVAVNQEMTDIAAALRDGDEVALFPPVTGG